MFQGRGIIDTITRHSHNVVHLLEDTNELLLVDGFCSGEDTTTILRKQSNLFRLWKSHECLAYEGITTQKRPHTIKGFLREILLWSKQTNVSSNALRRNLVIARNHKHTDTRVVAVLNGLVDLGTSRILHSSQHRIESTYLNSTQTVEDHVRFDFFKVGRGQQISTPSGSQDKHYTCSECHGDLCSCLIHRVLPCQQKPTHEDSDCSTCRESSESFHDSEESTPPLLHSIPSIHTRIQILPSRCIWNVLEWTLAHPSPTARYFQTRGSPAPLVTYMIANDTHTLSCTSELQGHQLVVHLLIVGVVDGSLLVNQLTVNTVILLFYSSPSRLYTIICLLLIPIFSTRHLRAPSVGSPIQTYFCLSSA